jgi:sigma-B regulation protein RsbU (phosphoserine phosphatase)
VGWSGYRVYRESTDRWQVEMDTRLERVATLAAKNVDVPLLKTIRLPTDLDSPAYEQIADQLEQGVLAANIAWLGIYYREGDYYYYWVDYDYVGVGYPFFYATPAHQAVYADQQPRPVQYTDEFGSYYGYVAPLIETNEVGQPEVVGLVEALVDEESRYLLQQATLRRILPILLGGSLAAIALAALITSLLFNRPLRQLKQGTLALAGGQFGHTISLASRDELGDLAEAFNRMSLQLKQLYREQAERERLQHELKIAQQVQRAIFPAEIPHIPGLTIAAVCLPHRETSGDFYDLLPLAEGQVGVVVGDVSGKSIPAAMVMVATQSIVRAEAYNNLASPGQVLDKSNTILAQKIVPGMFSAVSYACIDAPRREIVWANAGQIYPFLLHRPLPSELQTEYPRYLETQGISLPLGMDASLSYQTHHLSLAPDDMLLFYTDGIVEAMNPARQIYGFERLETLVRSLVADLSPQTLLEAVLADVALFTGPAEQHDDMTMVAVKLTGEVS